MNLGKLLAAGKSIMGGRREISYRVSDRVYLPKFISPKNPFAPGVKPESAPRDVAAPKEEKRVSDGSKMLKRLSMPVFRQQYAVWISRINPLSAWRRSAPRAPLKPQGPMQVELSLDRVKVVHNDLSDADVEIVPIKSRTAELTMDPAEAPLAPANGGDSWSRLGAKLFGVKTV